MRSLHVAQVCADRGIAPGSTKGAAQHLRGLAAGLANLGHDVITYAAREPEGPYPVPVVGLGDLADPGADAIDVVYERYSLGHRSGLDHARARGVPFVLEVNAPLVDEAAIHRPDTVDHAAPDVEAELLAEADLVVTVSGELTRWVGRRRTGPTVTVRNGFEPRWFREPRADHAAIRYPLVFLGHPKPWHGADRIVSLLLDLARLGHHPDALVIGGGSGGDVVRRAARRARVADRLHITGPLPPDRASAMLAEAGIGLAPYPRQEPFYFCPLKVIDYLAAGLPVVATDQGDIPQIVGDAGYLVDPDDHGALVAAVVELLDSPRQRRTMGRAGRRRAMATMTWDRVAARTVEAIRLATAPAESTPDPFPSPTPR